jgi:hypothetical protein
MNANELKMILDALSATTGAAQEFGTVWILAHYGLSFLSSLLGFLGFIVFVYAVYRVILAFNSKTDSVFMRKCRSALFPGTGGYVTEEEYSATTEKIMELIQAHIAAKRGHK